MSSQLALLQVHLACSYLMPLDPSAIDNIDSFFKTTNELAMLNLYIACKSIAALNTPWTSINENEEKKTGNDCKSNLGSILGIHKPLQPSVKLATQLPNGYSVYPDIGVAYKLYREIKSWTEASEYCQREGANLAVIDTIEKAQYVTDLKGSKSGPDVYIGIHRSTDDDHHVDIKTGKKLENLPWIQTEHLSDTGRKCAVVPYIGGGIVAAHCHLPYDFVCEVSLLRQ